MTVTVLAHLTINENAPRELAKYFEITAPLLRKAGARIINRFSVGDLIVGENTSKQVVVVEYPDRQAVSDVFDSPEYRSAQAARDIAFREYHVSICVSEETEETGSDAGPIKATKS